MLQHNSISYSRHTVEFSKANFSYLKFGYGNKLLIALPGYANEADLFLKIAGSLVEEFTVVALDLPWHGGTKIKSSDFGKEDFSAVLKSIINSFSDFEVVEFMGYSYGGRLCLGVLHEFKIERLWLVAADGLEKRRGYNFFPVRLRKTLSRLMYRPNWFLKMLSFLFKIGIVPKYTHRFMTHHLGNEQNKNRLLGTWVFTAGFVSDQKKLLENLREKQIPVIVIYGREDKIIHSEGGLKLQENYPLAEVHFVSLRETADFFICDIFPQTGFKANINSQLYIF